MQPLATLAQSLGIAYAAGVNLYATVAILGLLEMTGRIGPLPGALGLLGHPAVIGIALALALFEFLATLVPGVASAWETFHSLVRPPAAAALAVLTAWHGDALLILVCALLGGTLGLATHATKLGIRYAVDTSPEPISNGVVNVAELGIVSSVSYYVWYHPFLTIAVALAILVATLLVVRLIWRTLRRVFSGQFTPRCGTLQEARAAGIRQRIVPAGDLDD